MTHELHRLERFNQIADRFRTIGPSSVLCRSGSHSFVATLRLLRCCLFYFRLIYNEWFVTKISRSSWCNTAGVLIRTSVSGTVSMFRHPQPLHHRPREAACMVQPRQIIRVGSFRVGRSCGAGRRVRPGHVRGLPSHGNRPRAVEQEPRRRTRAAPARLQRRAPVRRGDCCCCRRRPGDRRRQLACPHPTPRTGWPESPRLPPPAPRLTHNLRFGSQRRGTRPFGPGFRHGLRGSNAAGRLVPGRELRVLLLAP